MIADGMKKCSKCGEEKPVNKFHKNAGKGDGYQSYCKKCKSALDKIDRLKKKEQYKLLHPNEVKISRNKGKKRSEATRKKMSESHKGKIKTPEHLKNIGLGLKKYYDDHPEKRIEASNRVSGKNHPMYGKSPSKESLKKQSESMKRLWEEDPNRREIYSEMFSGENNPMFGKIHTREAHIKMSIGHIGIQKGENHPMYGKHPSEATLKKLRESHLNGLQSGENHYNWKGGISFEPYCPKFNKKLKMNVRNFFGNKCVLCEITRDEYYEEFIVHHVFTEKMACCETRIEEMDEVRKRLPSGVARFGEDEFTEEEIMYIRMMVPLCRKCHGKQNAASEKLPYEQTVYRKFFTELILNEYDGKCYSEENK